MQLGMIGLGKMGANMSERLVRGGHDVVGYDRDNQVMAYADAGADCRLQRVTDLHRF